LHTLIQRRIQNASNQLNTRHTQLQNQSPLRAIAESKNRLSDISKRIVRAQKDKLESSQVRLANLSKVMNSVSPLATLSRGYSISFAEKDIVKSVKQLNTEQILTTRFHDGEITSKITSLKSKE
jgi:exodeoxyribonuclease VII large subunit